MQSVPHLPIFELITICIVVQCPGHLKLQNTLLKVTYRIRSRWIGRHQLLVGSIVSAVLLWRKTRFIGLLALVGSTPKIAAALSHYY